MPSCHAMMCHDVSCHVSRICRNSSSGLAWGTYEYEHMYILAISFSKNVFFYIVRSLHYHPLLMVAGGWSLVLPTLCKRTAVHNKPRMHHTVHYTKSTQEKNPIQSNDTCVVQY